MSDETLRVLLVETEANIRERLAQHLQRRYAYQVVTATTAPEALTCLAAAQGQFDVILLAESLTPQPSLEPELSGIELMIAIKTDYPDLEFILITGADTASRVAALRAGACRTLTRPVDPDELAVLIEAVAKQTHIRHERDLLSATREISQKITSHLSTQQILEAIVDAVPRLVAADISTVVLLDPATGKTDKIRWIPLGKVEVTWKQHCREKKLTRFIVQNGKPYPVSDVDTEPDIDSQLRQAGVKSFVGVPIPGEPTNLGVLYAYSFRSQTFKQHDLQVLELLAGQAAIALENARLYEETQARFKTLRSLYEANAKLTVEQAEQTDLLQRLVDSSPLGIVAVDKDGYVINFNDKTLEILGYSFEQLQGELIYNVYFEAKEARKIGRLLYEAPGNKLRNHNTFLRNVYNERIPIRLSATWLYNAHGNKIGSVGYFEDLRTIQATEKRLDLLLRASNIIAQTENLKLALYSLAQMLVEVLDKTYCRILILKENKQVLVAEAAYKAEGDDLVWKPGLNEEIELEPWQQFAALLRAQGPLLLRFDHEAYRPFLAELSKKRGFTSDIQSLLMLPLRTSHEEVGLLALGELRPWDSAPFSPEQQELTRAIAAQTATLIDRVWSFERYKAAREQLRTLYAASNTLISDQNPDDVLQKIISQVRVAAGAAWVSITEINALGQTRNLITDGKPNPSTSNFIRPQGISMQVMQRGQPFIIEDTHEQRAVVNPLMFESNIRAALCLPFSVRGKRIGVMWIHYHATRQFSELEVDALQLYVNQAAIAYDNARRMTELNHLRQADQHLAEAIDVQNVLEQIVEEARRILHADSAAIWSYDAERDKFITAHSVAAGIPADIWAEFQKEEPRLGQTADMVMKQGWIDVEAVDRQRYPFLGESTQRLLSQLGVKSFAGIALKVGEEQLGVLYMNYSRLYKLSLEEHDVAQTFSSHAALALKKAKLLNEVIKARNVAKIVADVTVLENLENTLNLVARETQNALDSDAIALFVYDQEKDAFKYPPNLVGLDYMDRALRHQEVLRHSIVYEMLNREQIYIADDVASDPMFKDRRFAKDEKIASCLATPLAIGNEKVGVMFVNYRVRHRFTGNELINLQLFAHQAAVAIRNAQLYEKLQKRAADLEVLNRTLQRQSQHQQAVYLASKVISGEIATEQRQLLDRILEQAIERIKPARAEKCILGAIQLYEAATNTIHIESVYPSHVIDINQNLIGQKRPLDGSQGSIGISGRTILECRPQRVADVSRDPDYVDFYLSTQSQLSIPLLAGEQVLGVLSLESDQPNAFDEEDEQALQALAELSVIAIQNARRYQELRQTRGLVGARTALAWMGMANSTWRHSIEKHALTIREQTQLLRRHLNSIAPLQLANHHLNHSVDARLTMIERLSYKISEKPINPPLSAEEGVEVLVVNELIDERTQQLWRNDRYKSAQLELKLQLSHNATVWGSREWLRRAFDILVDNAINAVAHSTVRKITIGTQVYGDRVEISVADTGPGIPNEIRQKIGMELIEKPEDAKGLGMGLLMAQTIVHTYNGKIHVADSTACGTVMIIDLPLEQKGLKS